jgi:hypothetical protein
MRALLPVFMAIASLARSGFGSPPQLVSASRVEAFRLAPTFDEHYRTSRRFHGAKLVSGPRSVSASQAALAARELERIYRIDWPSRYCAFAPRYGLRFHLPSGTVDVLLCPHCGEAHFITTKSLRRANMEHDDSELLRVLKALFPRYPLRDNEA